MYIDLIHYRLAENASEEQLRSIAQRVHDDWMKNLPGFLRWEIHKREDGSYTDFVYWESREAAKGSEEHENSNPHTADWYACYDFSSIQSVKLDTVAAF